MVVIVVIMCTAFTDSFLIYALCRAYIIVLAWSAHTLAHYNYSPSYCTKYLPVPNYMYTLHYYSKPLSVVNACRRHKCIGKGAKLS